ncbi:hypothetical protein [Streptomyces sp. NPDC057939]|uniref:hypothetical protein n=1 Tax=Streptomyces sp. NPDC057939 TaxID=3346284 RepID=UPI0036E862FF
MASGTGVAAGVVDGAGFRFAADEVAGLRPAAPDPDRDRDLGAGTVLAASGFVS